jgi:hypothetical protein
MGIASAIHEGSLARVSARTLEQERVDRDRQLLDFEDLVESDHHRLGRNLVRRS